MPNSPKATDVLEADFSASQAIEQSSVLGTRKAPPNPSQFRFEKVNEVTWKLTNGEQTNVPASHGQWAGYRTLRAIAWVICIAPSAWLARCRDQVCGPECLSRAKAEAVAMAKGGDGDYHIQDPIAHLNGLQAILLHTERGAASD
jgi:hypothetical protein